MNSPSLVPGRPTREEASTATQAAASQTAGTTIVRLHAHSPKQPRRSTSGTGTSSDGTSALATPITAPAPPRLHAVGSPHEQQWVAQLAARITGAAIEVLAGRRPVHQLVEWVHRDILATLKLRAALSRKETPGSSPQLALIHRGATVLSSRASMVRPGVYEACAVVADRLRCRAVALRLEHVPDSGWRVTALEIG